MRLVADFVRFDTPYLLSLSTLVTVRVSADSLQLQF
jgi:hypothetical protein